MKLNAIALKGKKLRQPIEDNQPLLPVYTASDFNGFTLEQMNVWYPHHCQEAAHHFGLTLDS